MASRRRAGSLLRRVPARPALEGASIGRTVPDRTGLLNESAAAETLGSSHRSAGSIASAPSSANDQCHRRSVGVWLPARGGVPNSERAAVRSMR